MTRAALLALPLTLAFALALPAADPCVSGVPVGKRPGPYSFLVATGPQRGQPTCFICEQADKPAAVVFARSLSDPLGKLLAKLDAEAAARKETGFKVWMTLLTPAADLDALAKWAQKQGLKDCPVGAFEDADGPPAYTLNKDADATVMLFTRQRVVANFAYRAGELDDKQVGSVLLAVPTLFEKK
ncbi:MAG: hypothetical protein K2P78_00575 [Gemmataceae bacterium]|nr:hypothetical protein [Gemmataceae bacterium]